MSDARCEVLLTADKAWTEDNGKIGLAGIFEKLNLPQFPVQILPFSLYVRLSDVARGSHTLVVNVISEDTHSTLCSVTVGFVTQQDSEVFQLQFPVPSMVVPSPGKYAIHLSLNGVQVAKRFLEAEKVGS